MAAVSAVIDSGLALGGAAREQEMLKGHLPINWYMQIEIPVSGLNLFVTRSATARPVALDR